MRNHQLLWVALAFAVALVCDQFPPVACKDGWDTEYFEPAENDNVEYTHDGPKLTITFDEERKADYLVGRFLNTDTDGDMTLEGRSKDIFKIERGSWTLKTTQNLDYENEKEDQTKLEFRVIKGDVVLDITVHVHNINDNPIQLCCGSCSQAENNEIGFVSTCKYTIEDRDGLSEELSFLFKSSGLPERFSMDKEPKDIWNEKSATLYLKFLTKEDFETENIIALTWTAEDERDKDDLLIMVKILDEPDMPPNWKNFIGSINIKEEEDYSMQLEAEDGDRGLEIKSKIIYELEKLDENDQLWSAISIKEDQLLIQKITLKDPNHNSIKFKIIAIEVDDTSYRTPQTVVLMVEDINNNFPVVTIKPKALTIDEEPLTLEGVTVGIIDMDIGLSGTYKVSLYSPQLPRIDDVLQIIPSTGYQEASFSLLIKDGSQMDYDQLESDVVTIKISAVDDDPTHIRSDTIDITLKDLNDEPPLWQKDEYTVQIPETFGRLNKDEVLPPPIEGNFFAVDADKEDAHRTITYAIVGDAAQKLLVLEEATPPVGSKSNLVLRANAATNAMQLFDYEREPTVLITLEASDGNPKNTKTTQLKIKLIDVNDEKPTLDVSPQTVSINEKTPFPMGIGITLTGADADEGRDLQYSILTEKSFVYKLGNEMQWAAHECISIDPKTGALTLDASALPDYQVYDSISLQLEVKDTKGEDPPAEQQTSERTLFITILNVHDLDPTFDDESLSEISVIEHSEVNRVFGVIKATDPDAPGWDAIKFALTPKVGTPPGLIKIHPDNGNLQVAGDIDADPDHFFLEYDVTATVEERSVTKPLTIKILDTNDHKPEPAEKEYTFEIDEHHPGEKEFDLIKVTDGDRDKNYKDFECYATNLGELADIYAVSNRDQEGCVVKVVKGEVIDYDPPGTHQHAFNVIVWNSNDNRNEKVTIPIVVKINDINDNKPSIKEGLKFESSENAKDGEKLETILGVDIDDGDNSDITFELLSVERQPEEGSTSTIELRVGDFDIKKVSDKRNADVILKKNLLNFYGTYILTFKASNEKSKDPLPTTDNKVTLVVQKVNTKPVKFDYPTNEEEIPLLNVQEIGQKLVLVGGDAKMKSLAATDQQGNKFAIEFTFCNAKGEKVDDENFRIAMQSAQTGDLYLKKTDVLAQGYYDLHIKAQSIGALPPLDAPIVKMSLRFVSPTAEPTFKEQEFPCSMDEMFTGELPCPLPLASGFAHPEERNAYETTRYINYYIYESVPEEAYEILDKSKPVVTVKKELDLMLLPDGYSSFTVEASFGPELNTKPEPASLMKVTMNIKDINNHPPTFPPATQMGALLIGKAADKKLDITLSADDPDTNDELKYEIDWDSYETSNPSLPGKVPMPFDTPWKPNSKNRVGELIALIEVKASMSGLIQFDIVVEDFPRPAAGDSSAKMHVELYVIGDVHLCAIVFENILTDVENRKKEVLAVLQEQFQPFSAGISDIRAQQTAGTYDEDAGAGYTEVIAYFIDTELKQGIENTEIKSKLNNYAFFTQLRNKFREHSLVVKNVYIELEEGSLEEEYKIALIVVSSIFGVLLIAIIGFFTYKIRTTNSRLDRLDQAEARRPTMIHNLPGANRRATQVVNPNISNLQETEPVEDDLSFTNSPRNSKRRDSFDDTDDEDFVGVENNDIFKITPPKY